MRRTTMYLKARQVKELKALSAQTGATMAELVRRAVDAFLAVRRKAEKKEDRTYAKIGGGKAHSEEF